MVWTLIRLTVSQLRVVTFSQRRPKTDCHEVRWPPRLFSMRSSTRWIGRRRGSCVSATNMQTPMTRPGCVPPKRAFQGRIAKQPICDRRPRFGMAVAGPDLSRGGQPLGLGCRGGSSPPFFQPQASPFWPFAAVSKLRTLIPVKQYAVPRLEFLSP